jgi:hypothetical protein
MSHSCGWVAIGGMFLSGVQWSSSAVRLRAGPGPAPVSTACQCGTMCMETFLLRDTCATPRVEPPQDAFLSRGAQALVGAMFGTHVPTCDQARRTNAKKELCAFAVQAIAVSAAWAALFSRRETRGPLRS